MDRSQQKLLEQLKADIKEWEGQEVEFMEKYPDNTHELAKEMAAFASSNKGRIYLGVEDDGTIVGVSKSVDNLKDRIAGLTQSSVKPPLEVTVEAIHTDQGEVLRIDVPKGREPIYYVQNTTPYVRNLSTSQRATPDQVKNAHQQYFSERINIQQEANEEQEVLINALNEISDFQLLCEDIENRDTWIDLNQVKYDLRATSEALWSLSREPESNDLNLSSDLESLGDMLKGIANHRISMDGGKSWKAFVEKAKEGKEFAEKIVGRIRKRIKLSEQQNSEIREALLRNIKELNMVWERRESYLQNGELTRLRETFRKLSYLFNRAANLPPNEVFSLNSEIGNLASNLREISTNQYFKPGLGTNPLDLIEPEMEEILELSERIENEVCLD